MYLNFAVPWNFPVMEKVCQFFHYRYSSRFSQNSMSKMVMAALVLLHKALRSVKMGENVVIGGGERLKKSLPVINSQN
jgi:hypothetical protein